MKGLLCSACVDFRALAPEGSVSCRCGNVTAWWVDPVRGVAKFRAINRQMAFGIGFHNSFLIEATTVLRGLAMPEDWRQLHEKATDAPGYMFDKSRRDCWALIFKPGSTSDTSWDDDGQA
jgi:hypothetical protein